ncbi:MAG: hypothetical protein HW403_1133, partial [Dehalococcoidia bacterium]|nr:hypothetical protein [Dehalococcoidia bacterium]
MRSGTQTSGTSRRLDAHSPVLDKPVLSMPWVGEYKWVYLVLILVAAAMHFWDLGSRALHHDESLHAIYSWYLYMGRGYQHDPMMHGPFQFHATALIYFLFGASDYTARLLPAIFGTALVGLPYFLRDQLGKRGVLIASLFLAISPGMLYFGRFARNDIYIAVWTTMMVIALWRYQAEGRNRYLYLLAASLSLSFATKEVTYITVAIFGSYLFLSTAREVIPKLLKGFALSDLSPRAAIMVLMGTLALPQGAAAVELLKGVPVSSGAESLSPGSAIAVGSVAVLLAVSAAIGLRWNPRVWLTCAAIFYSIYVVLYTTVFTHPSGLGSGIWGSLHYWLAQQEVQRGGQPWYYYLVVLPIYEFLPLLFAVVGMIYFSIKREAFTVFLIYWTVGALVLYSYAGEKMPWLSVHLALPLILLAATTIDRLFRGMSWDDYREMRSWIFLLLL